MKTKICSKCNTFKNKTEFYKNKNNSDGLCCWCKECCKRYGKQYRINNVEYLKQQKKKYYKQIEVQQSQKCWKNNNPDKVKQYYKIWSDKNKEKIKQKNKRFHNNNPTYSIEYRQLPESKELRRKRNSNRRLTDPIWRLHKNLSSLLRYHLKRIGSSKDNIPLFKFLDITAKEFDDWALQYIDKPCLLCGTSLDVTFEVDHIEPISRAKTDEDVKRLSNPIDNLRMICKPCNRAKGSKY